MSHKRRKKECLASNFKKCNRRQLDLKECVFEAARHGITQLTRPYRRLNIPSFDPLEIRELSTHSERVLVNMSEQLTNCKFFGLNNVKLEKFEFDLDQKTIDAAALFPKFESFCDYKIDGRIMFVKINSKGKSSITFENVNSSFHITYDEIKKGTQTYVKIRTSTCDICDKPERIHFQIDNIIDGDEEA
ncbi:unnamed protein product, partial [Tenebrio molitor]